MTLSPKIHSVLDYLVSIFLIVAPWLMNFAEGGTETWVFVASGVTSIFYSLLTKYEFSLVDLISFSTHLKLDVISGVILATSPWVFGFHEVVYLPHLLLGLLELTVVALTRKNHEHATA